MKRSDALKLIANQLDFLAGTFNGVRTEFTQEEMGKANVLLTTLESAGMVPPKPIIKFENGNDQSTIRFYLMIGWDKEEVKELPVSPDTTVVEVKDEA